MAKMYIPWKTLKPLWVAYRENNIYDLQRALGAKDIKQSQKSAAKYDSFQRKLIILE